MAIRARSNPFPQNSTSSSPQGGDRITLTDVWQKIVEERHWFLIAVPLLICMWGPIHWLADVWKFTSDAQGYQPFVPLGIAYLVWAEREEIANAYYSLANVYDEENKRRRGTPLVAYAGCILLLLSYLVSLPTIAVVGFLLTIIGVVLHVYGFTVLRTLWRPALFSLVMVPIPNVIENMATSWLQLGCTFAAGQVLHIFHPETIAKGNFISIGPYTAQVTGPCSGVGILLPVLVLTFFLSLLRRMNWITTLILLVSSAGISLVMNTIRIVIMGLIGVDNAYLAQQFHDANSIIFTAFAFALTFLLAGKIGPRMSNTKYDDTASYLDDDEDEDEE